MILSNKQYTVEISTEVTPSLDGYRVIYPADIPDFYCARLIEVKAAAGTVSRLALSDKLISAAEPCAVLEDNILTVPIFAAILQIDLNTQTLLRCADCKNMGGLEEIYPIDGGYIIKSECEIFRYDKALNQIWQRAGRDIFARPTAEKCFWIENNLIHCRDWEGWHYVLDVDGKTIHDFQEV